MKNFIKNKGILVTIVTIFLCFSAVIVIAQTSNDEVNACINNKTGSVRVINFIGGECSKNETSIVWNKQGIQGMQGEQGLPSQQGAGNIAFMFNGDPSYLLKTDGTVWLGNMTSGWGGPLFTQVVGDVANLPVPVSDIVDWEYYSFIDKNGNYWYFEYHTGDNVWHNFGPLP